MPIIRQTRKKDTAEIRKKLSHETSSVERLEPRAPPHILDDVAPEIAAPLPCEPCPCPPGWTKKTKRKLFISSNSQELLVASLLLVANLAPVRPGNMRNMSRTFSRKQIWSVQTYVLLGKHFSLRLSPKFERCSCSKGIATRAIQAFQIARGIDASWLVTLAVMTVTPWHPTQ